MHTTYNRYIMLRDDHELVVNAGRLEVKSDTEILKDLNKTIKHTINTHWGKEISLNYISRTDQAFSDSFEKWNKIYIHKKKNSRNNNSQQQQPVWYFQSTCRNIAVHTTTDNIVSFQGLGIKIPIRRPIYSIIFFKDFFFLLS